MTTSIFAAAPTNTADADFRTWGSAVRTALTAVGLVRTADTGQIDWTTVLKAAAINTYQGYEIWRFNDALQATVPLFLKVEYGTGSNINAPSIRVQIGKGSNGSGTLTTPIGSTFASGTPVGSGSATVTNWYMSSGDGSMLAFVMAPALASTATKGGFLLVERSRDASGAATGVGVLGFGGAASNVISRNYASTAGQNTPPAGWPVGLPAEASAIGSTLTVGGGSPMFQGTVTDGAGIYWQPRCALTYLYPDCAALAAVTIAGFGTYMPMGLGMNAFNGSSLSVYGVGAIAWS